MNCIKIVIQSISSFFIKYEQLSSEEVASKGWWELERPRDQQNRAERGPPQAYAYLVYQQVPTEQYQGGSSHTFSEKSVRMGASLKSLSANTHSMGNKQYELELCAQLQGCDLVGISEPWWDSSHDWKAAVDGYRDFKKDRPGWRGAGESCFMQESSGNAWSSA